MKRSLALIGLALVTLVSAPAWAKTKAEIPTEITVSVYDVSNASAPVLLSSRPMVVLPVAPEPEEDGLRDFFSRPFPASQGLFPAASRSTDEDFTAMRQRGEGNESGISYVESRFSPLDFEGQKDFISHCMVVDGKVLSKTSRVNTGLAGTAETSRNNKLKVNLMFSSVKQVKKIPGVCVIERPLMDHAFLIKRDIRLVKNQEMVIAHTDSDETAPKLEFHLLWK